MEHVHCDLCGTDDSTLLFHARDTNYHLPGLFPIVRCRRCGLVYLTPRPTPGELAHYYPDSEYTCFRSAATEQGLGPHHPFTRMSTQLKLKPGWICDVGCGAGSFLVQAQRSGWNVIGVEVNAYARRLANERLGQSLVFPSLQEAAHDRPPLDAVTLWHVLEHLPSPRQSLLEIYRAMRSGGALALAMPNFDSLERRIWGKHWIAIMAPTHLYHFTPRTLSHLVKECGFEIHALEQQPAAVSLASNLLRTLRIWLLDPLARSRKRRSSESAGAPGTADSSPLPSYCQVDRQHHDRILRWATRLVYPISWLAARRDAGPELVLWARKKSGQGR